MACCKKTDILEELPEEDLPKLRDFYERHLPHATKIYSFINTAIKWKKIIPDGKFLTFYATYGNWKSDGTFIALLQSSCYDLIVFTMDPACELLYKGLKETKRIDYVNNTVLFYALHQKLHSAVCRALNESNIPINLEVKNNTYWMPKEKAQHLSIECPEGYYIDILKPEHSPIINELWPHKFDGSVGYVETLIKMSGGHGVFTKSENRLVSWVLKSHMGILAILQTAEDHKRKGLGSVVTASLSKEIALDGHNPVGYVVHDNSPSISMFSKLGFTLLDRCIFVAAGNGELRFKGL